MPLRDHRPFIITNFRGLYCRRDRPVPPQGYLTQCDNAVFSQPAVAVSDASNSGSIRVRENFSSLGALPAVPVRFVIYQKSSGYRIILLDATGQFWDSVSGLVIATIVDATSFTGVTINDHFYFTPHNGEVGLDGEALYVYDPDLATTARKAAGAPMTGTFTVALSAVTGTIEPGIHILAISYDTNTGFRTKPALHQLITMTAARKKLSLTAIPLGPSWAVRRVIWMSKVVLNYDGNIAAVPLFVVYKIENNTTTALADTIDAYDTQLVSSADPYLDTLPEIPAGSYISNLGGRLTVCGDHDTPHVVRVSNPNEPENIDSVDGVREIMRGEGTGVRTTRPLRGNLVCWKHNKTAILRATEETPVLWPVEEIDYALGSSVFGVSEIIDSDGMFGNLYLVASDYGLVPFDGVYQNYLRPLTYNIEPVWKHAFQNAVLGSVKVIVDPKALRVYVIVPHIDTSVIWFMGDFNDGLDADNMKWSIWRFNYLGVGSKLFIDAHVVNDPAVSTTGTALLSIVSGSALLRQLFTDTFTSGEDHDGGITFQAGVKTMAPELFVNHVVNVNFVASAKLGSNIGAYDCAGEAFTPTTEDSVVETSPVELTSRFPEAMIAAFSGDLNVSDFVMFVKEVYKEEGRR